MIHLRGHLVRSLSLALLCTACVTNPYESATPGEIDHFKEVRLPLPSGTMTTIRQGAFGKSSHHEPGNEYHWDFAVPLPTEVLAVAPGTVIAVWENGKGGGCDPKFAESMHHIKILHDDGTVAQYGHIKSHVTVGEEVSEGQIIAETAWNGWICYTHLHFGVYASKDELYDSPQRKTLPLRFRQVSQGILREQMQITVP